MYIAHRREEDKEEQELIKHLENTARKAAEFGKSFNNGEYAYVCGLLHDIGKYSDAFQRRIRDEGKKCDHSTAGARIINQYRPFGMIGAYCISGHHSGLQDCGSRSSMGEAGTLYGRLDNAYAIPKFDMYMSELDLTSFNLNVKPNLKPLNKGGFSLSFFIRIIYSCLVDADYIDTEAFMINGQIDRSANYSYQEYLNRLITFISDFNTMGLINQRRSEILKESIKKAQLTKGLFTLTVPTGGGKTVSSLAFALNHLIKNNMDRIIYVIPYTSIIEQNAKVFRDILGDENVLEHHSNFDFQDKEDGKSKLHLSSENWNIPLTVTTNVQFFESLFACKSSKCRKLHNMCNSIIIFDEVQMLPLEYLSLCINAISELVYNYNSTVVLCSATQPAIVNKFPTQISCIEICEGTKNLYNDFRRSKIVIRDRLSLEELTEEMNNLRQCLCIVNTRKHALKIFEMLTGDGNYHLSTLMCPVHRKKVLNEIRERLKSGHPCRVISTRLIEAGVDVDFPQVYRSISGIDSIVQAAGRCNREGKLLDIEGNPIFGEVHVFEPEEEFSKRQPEDFKRSIEVSKHVIEEFEDITSPDAIKSYFNILYKYVGEQGQDIKGIYKRLEEGCVNNRLEYEFQTIAEEFKLIADNTYSIIIPYDGFAQEEIERLKYAQYIGPIMRALQGYTVNIYEGEYKALLGAGKLRCIKEDIMGLITITDYDDRTGINIKEELGKGIYL